MLSHIARSEEYLHESSCGLDETDHKISQSFVDVAYLVSEKVPVECEVAATGCGSCLNSDAPAAIFWVAQNDATNDVALKYDSTADGFSRKELGQAIVDAAEELSVKVSWNGDPMASVKLGVEDAYKNLDVGTRVEGTSRRYSGRTGTVLNDDWFEDAHAQDGDNIVLFDESDRPARVSTSDLDVLDE